MLGADVEAVVEEAEDEAVDDLRPGDFGIALDAGADGADVAALDECHDAGVGLDSGRALQHVEGANALRALILKQARAALQARDDHPAERERDRCEDGRDDEDQAGVPGDDRRHRAPIF